MVGINNRFGVFSVNDGLNLALKTLNSLKSGELQRCSKQHLMELYAQLGEYDNQYMDTLTQMSCARDRKKRDIINSLRLRAESIVSRSL